MATIEYNSQYLTYSLTEAEELAGNLLIQDQKQVICNYIADLSAQILALVPDPLNYPIFIQQDAHLKGQLHAYQFLLDCSKAAEVAIKSNTQSSQFN